MADKRNRTATNARGAAIGRHKSKSKTRARQAVGSESTRFYYKGNRLKQLRAFCYAVKFGTVARAAESLFLSSSSVSLQLSALESDFGARLLERTRPRLTLTADGQSLYDLARPLVEGMENLDHQFRSRRTGEQALEIHIACGNSTIQYLLPRMGACLPRAITRRAPANWPT